MEMRQHKMGEGEGVQEGQNVVTAEKGEVQNTW